MELSKRLKSVADMVTKGNRVVDVGCDHGYVSLYLLKEKIAPCVIAMDVNKGPLECARQNVEREGLAEYIELRLSDGLRNLSTGEADTVICAGMGGRLINRILSNSSEIVGSLQELILQPQSEIHLVRKYLYEIGFVIVQENMVLDEGKYYQMMRAVKVDAVHGHLQQNNITQKQITEVEAKYGPYLLKQKHPVLKEFLLVEKNKYEKILFELKKTNPEKSGELNKKCLLIEEALVGYIDEV